MTKKQKQQRRAIFAAIMETDLFKKLMAEEAYKILFYPKQTPMQAALGEVMEHILPRIQEVMANIPPLPKESK